MINLIIILTLGFFDQLTLVQAICGPCNIPPIYNEIGCTPELERNECCPQSFKCPPITETPIQSSSSSSYASSVNLQCKFQGKAYKVGETLTSANGLPCPFHACSCVQKKKIARFVCLKRTCGFSSPDCVIQYNLQTCCASRFVCAQDQIKTLTTCPFRNTTYYAGELIDSPFDSCQSCVCNWRFNDPNVPIAQKKCKRQFCGVELTHGPEIKKGCAPIYNGNNACCPVGFRCFKPSDRVIKTNRENRIRKKCQFGWLSLHIGDRLTSHNKCIKCKCNLPPIVDCQQIPNCK